MVDSYQIQVRSRTDWQMIGARVAWGDEALEAGPAASRYAGRLDLTILPSLSSQQSFSDLNLSCGFLSLFLMSRLTEQ